MSEIDVLVHHALICSNATYAKAPHALSFIPTPIIAPRRRRTQAEMAAAREVLANISTGGSSDDMQEVQELIIAAAKNEGFASPVRAEFAWALPSATASTPLAPNGSTTGPSGGTPSSGTRQLLFPSQPNWVHSPTPSGLSQSKRSSTLTHIAGPSTLGPQTPAPTSKKSKTKPSGLGRVLALGGAGISAGQGQRLEVRSNRSEDEVDELATPRPKSFGGKGKNPTSASASGSGLRDEINGDDHGAVGVDEPSSMKVKGKKRKAGDGEGSESTGNTDGTRAKVGNVSKGKGKGA